jgi:hypothetical protein
MQDYRFGLVVAALTGKAPSTYFPSLQETAAPTEGPDGRHLITYLKMYQALRDRKKREARRGKSHSNPHS